MVAGVSSVGTTNYQQPVTKQKKKSHIATKVCAGLGATVGAGSALYSPFYELGSKSAKALYKDPRGALAFAALALVYGSILGGIGAGAGAIMDAVRNKIKNK